MKSREKNQKSALSFAFGSGYIIFTYLNQLLLIYNDFLHIHYLINIQMCNFHLALSLVF